MRLSTIFLGKRSCHIWRIIREILSFIPKGRGTNINKALDFVSKVRKRKSVVFLISDFLQDDYERSFGALCSRHEVCAINVEDEMEFSLPEIGHVRFRDLETNEEALINTAEMSLQESLLQNYEKIRNVFPKFAVSIKQI